ncbi:CcdB family protein [Sphingomonas carotinifaciens]|uniref:CcdB family protein n=1 Tax=Sphingomonas carotinifaciens TaxID=1166323 RepID=UPI0039A38FFC
MARFDVHRLRDDGAYALNCQADTLSHLNTRLMVPLWAPDRAPLPMRRLNPIFEVDGRRMMMVTQFAGALPIAEIGAPVYSLAEHDLTIMAALDLLLTGV